MQQHRAELDALPEGVSLALISQQPLNGESTELRAPARSRQGAVRIAKLWLTQGGPKTTNWLKWGPRKSTIAVEAPVDTDILRIEIVRTYLDSKDWNALRTRRGVSNEYRSRIARVVSRAFVDVYRPTILNDGTDYGSISARLRVKQSEREAALASSGLAGVFIKTFVHSPKGAIKWLKPGNETMPEFSLRARTLAESASTCRGVAFSATGSLGLREAANSQARQWKLTGFSFSYAQDTVLKFLRDHGWRTEWAEQHQDGPRPAWTFKSIPPETEEAYSLLAPCGNHHLHVEISPWLQRNNHRTTAKPLNEGCASFRPKAEPEKPAASAAAANFTPAAPAGGSAESASKRARVNDDSDDNISPASAAFDV